MCGLFSSCELGLLSSCGMRASRCSGFSCRGVWALGFSSSVVGVCGLDCSGAWACGIFLDPGIEPVSSALEGRFFTTEPPGKPRMITIFIVIKTIDAIKRKGLITKESTGNVDVFS